MSDAITSAKPTFSATPIQEHFFYPLEFSDQLNELFAALSKAQGEMTHAVLDMKNPHYNSAYANLKSSKDAFQEPLAKHGLAILQPVFSTGGFYFVHTRLGHSSGQYIASTVKLIIDKNNMQGLGSAITYAKRYCANALIGVVDSEDDDGNASLGTEDKNKPQQPSAPPTNQNSSSVKPRASIQPPAKNPPTFPQGVPSGKPSPVKPVNVEVDDVDKSVDFVDEAFDDLGEPQTVLEILERLVERQGIDEQGLNDIIRKVTGLRLKPAALNTGQVERVISFIEKLYTKKA